MIELTRFNGDTFFLNQNLIEKIDVIPNTMITMNSQIQYVVKESIDEINDKIIEFHNKITFTPEEK
ncbi:MAG: flagellar FlbD family protein [Spirochaetes bacterium]|nr:flagellar FlbD family protein [Spirochaetota bacterium]